MLRFYFGDESLKKRIRELEAMLRAENSLAKIRVDAAELERDLVAESLEHFRGWVTANTMVINRGPQ